MLYSKQHRIFEKIIQNKEDNKLRGYTKLNSIVTPIYLVILQDLIAVYHS